jgi:hypothetical protein
MKAAIQIDCMYSCAICGIEKAHVKVGARTEGQDLKEWLESVAAAALSSDHARRSPDCRPPTLTEVYIPVTGAKMIGGPSVQ